MSIEDFVIQYLAEALTVPVSGDVPNLGTNEEFVTVEKLGGSMTNHIRRASIAVQSWSRSRMEACELNEMVKAAMERLTERHQISSAALSSDYNFPDLSRRQPRYQAVYEIVYF